MSSQWIIYGFLALILILQTTGASAASRRRKMNYPTIIVDPSGKGNFTTIQSAIDFIPADNKKWIRISIKKGVYREKVHIPFGKSFLSLEGEGKRDTYIVWDDHGPIDTCATFTSQGDYIIAKHITFVNSYNRKGSRNPIKTALAARIEGDKSMFYRCGFFGLQDTLWDVQGRHYFKLCSIQGAIDFIFGSGQSLYERCTISVNARVLGKGAIGYITAQGRSNPNETNGFIFKNCKIIGKGKTYLGRPWRDYARVLFYNTTMSDVVDPQGWADWGHDGREYRTTFVEYGCSGVGADTSKRVKWANKLSQEKLSQLVSPSFIDKEGWMNNV